MGKSGLSAFAGLMKNKDIMKIARGLNEDQIQSALKLAETVDLKKVLNPKSITPEEMEAFKSCANDLGIDGLSDVEV